MLRGALQNPDVPVTALAILPTGSGGQGVALWSLEKVGAAALRPRKQMADTRRSRQLRSLHIRPANSRHTSWCPQRHLCVSLALLHDTLSELIE